MLVKLLKIIFGRIGPEYWTAHNFNLQDYGFYWLQGNAINYQDFPSGHTSAMFTMLAIVWSLAPNLRLPGIALSLLVVIALLFTQSHYLADCIAGAFLGSFVGYRTLRFLE